MAIPVVWIIFGNLRNILTFFIISPSLCPSNARGPSHVTVIVLTENSDINLKGVEHVGLNRGTHIFLYNDVIMGAIASQITSLTIVYSTVYSDADQRKHQGTASLAGNSPETDDFPTQMASNAENVSIWWRHHVLAFSRDVLTISLFLRVYLVVMQHRCR